jgi:hypothetical protein
MPYDRFLELVTYSEGVPRCTDYKTYLIWKSHDTGSARAGPARFCTDCTLDYQQDMISQNLCDNPWIEIRIVGVELDAGITGCIPRGMKTRIRQGDIPEFSYDEEQKLMERKHGIRRKSSRFYPITQAPGSGSNSGASLSNIKQRRQPTSK